MGSSSKIPDLTLDEGRTGSDVLTDLQAVDPLHRVEWLMSRTANLRGETAAVEALLEWEADDAQD